MQTDERDDESGNNKHMQREESRQRFPRDDRSGEHEMNNVCSENRGTSHYRGADSQAPVSILIEAQDLACKGHSQRAEKQHDARYPRQLARIFESSEQKH